MVRFSRSLAVLGCMLGGAAAVHAADLAPAYKAPAPAAAYNWTGFYVGGNVGYGWARARGAGTVAGISSSGSENLNGVLGGVQLGYNWQVGQWVWGVETDIQATGQKATNVNSGLGLLWGERSLEAFLLGHQHFNSRVEYERLDAHELSPERVGSFDLVFCAGVLYHLRHPLLALEKIRSVTAGQLILETASLIPAAHERIPMITFFPGDAEAAKFSWHKGGFPTKAWMLHALSAVGFEHAEIVYSPSWRVFKKGTALLTNTPQHGRLIVHAFSNGSAR